METGDSHSQIGEELPVISEVIRDVVRLKVILYLLIGAFSTL